MYEIDKDISVQFVVKNYCHRINPSTIQQNMNLNFSNDTFQISLEIPEEELYGYKIKNLYDFVSESIKIDKRNIILTYSELDFEYCEEFLYNTSIEDSSDIFIKLISDDELLYQKYLKNIKNGTCQLYDLDKKFLTFEICLEAIRKNGLLLRFVPKKHINEYIYKTALQNNPDSARFMSLRYLKT